jgi:hypothetical protein
VEANGSVSQPEENEIVSWEVASEIENVVYDPDSDPDRQCPRDVDILRPLALRMVPNFVLPTVE